MSESRSNGSNVVTNLRSVGALKEGHFLLSSGRHADRYFEKFDLLRHPRATEEVCHGFRDQFAGAGIDVVVGPTTGGILLAFEVARQLGTEAAYAERPSDGAAGREFRRGTEFKDGQRVLVVDDILTTGGSLRDTLAALATEPVEVVAVAVLVDRSGGRVSFGENIPLFALATLDVASWDASECPLCGQGLPLTKPGTSASTKAASGR
jgi:orotate phosphoribosyltransferase